MEPVRPEEVPDYEELVQQVGDILLQSIMPTELTIEQTDLLPCCNSSMPCLIECVGIVLLRENARTAGVIVAQQAGFGLAGLRLP